MGKGGKITSGYWYSGTFHMGLCHGPLDAILEIRGDDKTMWPLQQHVAVKVFDEVSSPTIGTLPGPITASGSVVISAPNLYGGEKQEGGVDGMLTVLMGEAGQVPSPALASIESGPRPAYLDLATVVFTGRIAAMNPYIKPWRFRVSRYLNGWTTAVWQPTLAQVGRGMNPAHIIYQALTDTSWGAGEDPVQGLDLDSFLAFAQTISAEGMGLCLKWSMQDSIASFIGVVLDHVAGVRYVDPVTDKLGIRLLRGDYDAAALATDPANILDESNILEMTSYQYPVVNETINEVTVTYHDVDTNTDAAVTYQNLANVQAQGKVVSESVSYPGLYSADQASRVAARDCHSKSALLIKGETKIKSNLWNIKVGDVRLLSWAREKCVLMPIRILQVNYGDATSRSITISWAQDEFGVPASAYVQPAPGQWVEPDTLPHPITQQRVIEAPYRELARTLDAGTLAALTTQSGYLLAMGVQPALGVAQNFELCTRTGSDAFRVRATGDFAASGTLAAAITPLGTAITLATFAALDRVAVGTAALLEDEIVRVDAINTITGAVTLGRGCADTVPAAHAAGSTLWFFEDHAAADTTEYLLGEAVDAKLLTVAAQGMLDPALATTATTTLAGRQALPYPPARAQLNGLDYPASITGALTVSWKRRNRLTQADVLLDITAADVAPEITTRYGLRFRDSTNAVLVERTDIDASSAGVQLNYTGTVSMELFALTDAGQSLQSYLLSFAYTPPVGVSSSTITAPTYVPDANVVVINGGGD